MPKPLLAPALAVLLFPSLLAAGTPVVVGEQVTETAGEVVAINPKTRLMTLKQADGSYKVMRVPLEVKRIDEIRIGNRVSLVETTSVNIELERGRASKPLGTEAQTTVERAPGATLAGTITDELVFRGKVTGVDKARGTVSIRGEQDTQTFNVDDRALLNQFKVGDGVTARFRNRIAGEVTVGKRGR